MAAVRSPYIVHFYGATLEPKLVICLEYCSKGSLFHYLQDPSNELSWSLVLRWMVEAVRGINTLHLWKPTIVHRDMKSLNLLIDSNMTIKVCDFGLSRFVQAEQAPATLFKLRGTYAYIGPEVYHGSAFTTKTDVYSLGVVLWEMVFRLINGRHQRPYSEFPNLQHDLYVQHTQKKNKLKITRVFENNGSSVFFLPHPIFFHLPIGPRVSVSKWGFFFNE